MRKIVVLLAGFVLWGMCYGAGDGLSARKGLPSPRGLVSDFAGVLSSSEETRLTALLSEIERKTGCEIAVVSLDTTRPRDIQGYAVELFEAWGIGKKGKDNGLLLIAAIKDRKVRIETGYGLEGVIPDALAKQIIESLIVPAFKQGDYYKGLDRAVSYIAAALAKEYRVQINRSGPAGDLSRARSGRRRPSLLRLIFTLLFFILILGSRSGFLWFFLLGGARPGPWYSGGGSFGGGFSGFSGFGGGLSGGGGAGGSW